MSHTPIRIGRGLSFATTPSAVGQAAQRSYRWCSDHKHHKGMAPASSDESFQEHKGWGLPEVATEMMAETAMDAIAEHANAIAISGCPCFDSTDVDDFVADCRLNGAPTSCQDISFDFFSQLRCDVPLPGTYSASILVSENVEFDFGTCSTLDGGIFETLIMTREEAQACRAILREILNTEACDSNDEQ